MVFVAEDNLKVLAGMEVNLFAFRKISTSVAFGTLNIWEVTSAIWLFDKEIFKDVADGN